MLYLLDNQTSKYLNSLANFTFLHNFLFMLLITVYTAASILMHGSALSQFIQRSLLTFGVITARLSQTMLFISTPHALSCDRMTASVGLPLPFCTLSISWMYACLQTQRNHTMGVRIHQFKERQSCNESTTGTELTYLFGCLESVEQVVVSKGERLWCPSFLFIICLHVLNLNPLELIFQILSESSFYLLSRLL
jgi:hypothetical protein